MCKFFNSIVKAFFKIWLDGIKPGWSKFRWRNYLDEEPYPVEEKITSLDEAKEVFRSVYRCFDWTMDGVDELFDTYMPVEHIYNQYRDSKSNNTLFLGDCDDYASVAYHILHENGYDVASITIATNPASDSHTMVIYRDTDDCLVLINYSVLRKYDKDKTVQDVIDDYNRIYKYKPEYYWTLHKYDYDKHEYYVLDNKENF